jgi:hypothetical protein
MEENVNELRMHLTQSIVDHLIDSDGEIATPGSEVARVRRDVLRGLNKGAR